MKNTIQNAYNSLSKSSFLRFTVFSKITCKNSSNSLSKLVLFRDAEPPAPENMQIFRLAFQTLTRWKIRGAIA